MKINNNARVISLILLSFVLSNAWLGAEPPFEGFSPPSDYPNQRDYLSLLQRFPRYAEKLWHDGYRGKPEIGYFSTGMHDHNQMRSLSNFIFVYALLAADEEYDATVSGVGRNTLLEHATAAIRYFTATHVTGNMPTTDGRKWGEQPGQWVSPWVISKAFAGARLIWDSLTNSEKNALRRVVIHEANYQLTRRALTGDYRNLGGKFSALNARSEVNALNAEVLSWAASFYPTHANANRWRAKAQELFMNTFSVDSDKHNANLVDGKPVSRWVYTTNLYPDFTLEAHGAYQFDYIGAPMHSKAWAFYAFVSNGHPVPQALFHHLLDVWEASKKTHLNSGRFAYLQGKDWGRHVYGLYFIVPTLVVIQNEFGDGDARLVEQLRFRAFEWEQRQSGGGSIFGRQFAYQTKGWPLIYDTDCYANLGLAYLLHQQAPEILPESINTFQKKVEGNAHNKYAEFMHARSDDVFISFSWRHLSRRYPMGLFVCGDDYMAEWADGNLVGTAVVEGADVREVSSVHNEQFFENGFVTTGRIRSGKRGARYGVDHYLSFTALPKDRIAVMIESMVAKENIRVTEQFGLSYHLPNDLFNDSVRRIYSERGETRLRSTKTKLDPITIRSKWLNIDDKLGIVSLLNNGRFSIRPGKRQMWYGQVAERIDYVKGPPRITRYQKVMSSKSTHIS